MRKITRTALAIGVIFSSCQKQETEIRRNWFSPDGTMFCSGGAATGEGGTTSYLLEENLSDAQIVARILSNNNLDESTTIFLSPVVFGDVTTSLNKVDPEYLAFPKVLESMSDKWGWEYVREFHVDPQAFLDKYCDGKETGAMKYCNNF